MVTRFNRQTLSVDQTRGKWNISQFPTEEIFYKYREKISMSISFQGRISGNVYCGQLPEPAKCDVHFRR